MERFTFPSREDWREGETRIRGESLHDRRHFRGSQAGRTCSTEKKPSRFSANTCNCLLTPFLAHSGRIEKRWGGGRNRPILGINVDRFLLLLSFLFAFSFFLFPRQTRRSPYVNIKRIFLFSFFFFFRLSREIIEGFFCYKAERKEWFFTGGYLFAWNGRLGRYKRSRYDLY